MVSFTVSTGSCLLYTSCAAGAVELIAPDGVEQLVPGEYGPRMLHQKGEQLEFLQGEGDFPPVGQHLMAGRIDAQWAQSKGVDRLRLPAAVAQGCLLCTS